MVFLYVFVVLIFFTETDLMGKRVLVIGGIIGIGWVIVW